VDHLADNDIEMFLTPGLLTPAEVGQEGVLMDDNNNVTDGMLDGQRAGGNEVIDVDLDGDEEYEEEEAVGEEANDDDDDLLPSSSPLASSPLEEAHPYQGANQHEDDLDMDDLYDDTEFESSDQNQDETQRQNGMLLF